VKLDRPIFRRHKDRFGTRDPDKLRLATIKLSDRVTKATRLALAKEEPNREDHAGRGQGHLWEDMGLEGVEQCTLNLLTRPTSMMPS